MSIEQSSDNWRTRHKGSLVAVLALIVLVTGFQPSTVRAVESVPEAIGKVHRVARTTLFTATETSRTRIRFARSIRWTQLKHLHISGQGRLYGFILRKTGDYERESKRPFVKWMGSAMCTRPACRTAPTEHSGLSSVSFGGDISMLSGVWDAYVVADDALVTVKLVIRGSEGFDRIRATQSVPNEMRSLPEIVHERATDTIYSGGGFSRLGAPDFAEVAVITTNGPYLASTGGVCGHRTEEDAGPPEVAFFPGCPRAGATGTLALPYMTDAGPADRRNPLRTGGFVDGERGIGGWFATAAVVQDFAVVGFWIDFPEVNVSDGWAE